MPDTQTPQMTSPPDPENLVPDVKRGKLDKIGGFLGAISGGGALGSISDVLERSHQKRLAEAKVYHDAMVTKLSDPAYADESHPNHQKTVDAYNAVAQAYYKALGDKDAKAQAMQRAAIAEHHVKSSAQEGQQGAPGAAGATPVMSPPPATDTTASGATGGAAAASARPNIPPPPAAPDLSEVMAGLPAERQKMADDRTIAMDQRKQDILTASKIKEEKAKASGKQRHLQHVPVTNPATGQTEPGSYDPDSGEYLDQKGNIIENAQLAARSFSYAGPEGKPLMGWQVGDTLYDQQMKPLPPGTEKFVAWMQPRTTVNEGFKEVTQPDGSTKLVPVETTSTMQRGGTKTMTPPPASDSDTPSPYAKPGPYVTQLSPTEETAFQQWVKQNKIPWQDSPTTDYDMRGFWKAQQAGDPNARRSPNHHFPDTWKTPYHKLFSNESKYATADAPHWEGEDDKAKLVSSKKSPASTGGGGAKVKGPGVTVGGKVLPGVAKAFESYNSAQERWAVMQDALPRALKGDQQAMLNLLANHVGMTMGLQKGARITQGVYSEAQQSAPWLQRVGARFDKDGYLSGVVLTPDQMKQMIDLAKVRLDQDKAAWKREVDAAKTGYGMNDSNKKKIPPPPGPAPKTSDEYLKSIGL